jgi:hypothetical protein
MKHARVVLRRLVSPRVWVLTALVFALGASTSAFAAGKWVVMNSAGTAVRSKGLASSARLAAGEYEAIYKSNMTQCAYISTPGDPGAGAVIGPIINTVASRATSVNGVYLESWDQSTGTRVDDPIHTVTYCGSKVYAVVGSDGTLARGSNAASSARIGMGAYEVIFDRNVTKCAYTATLGTTGAGSVTNPGSITVVGRAGQKRGVFVRTVDRLGSAADYPFHLAVNCKGLYSVINTNGTLARGPHVVSSTKLGGVNTGTYEVIYDRVVSGCAYTATVGLPGTTGSITTPVSITTATRAGHADGVFVFIHHDNGSTIDEPFHLQVTC